MPNKTQKDNNRKAKTHSRTRRIATKTERKRLRNTNSQKRAK